MELKTIDNDGEWFVQTGAFRLPHAMRPGVVFEPGVKYLIKKDKWMEGQSATLKPTTFEADLEGQIQEPPKPKLPRVDKEKA